MRDKEPQFTVTDRRKFTAEGELREGNRPAKAARRQPSLSDPSRPRALSQPRPPRRYMPVRMNRMR